MIVYFAGFWKTLWKSLTSSFQDGGFGPLGLLLINSEIRFSRRVLDGPLRLLRPEVGTQAVGFCFLDADSCLGLFRMLPLWVIV